MRVQKNRIPQGFVLRPKCGLLVPIPRDQIGIGNQMAHHSGYAVGAGAHAVYMPVELAIDAVKAGINALANTTFGEGVQLGWHDVGHWKSSISTFISIRKLPIEEQKEMLVQTYPASQERQVRVMISRMTPFQISRMLADRITPNEYISEEITYNGAEEIVEDKPQKAQTQAKRTEMPADEGSVLEDAFAG